ncbi:MAG: helix-turn-helix domain-containing protein [Dehalococcoidia bacterium]
MVTLNDALTPSEAARVSGVSESAIRQWMRAGKLAYVRTPLGRLVDPVALGELIAAREAAARTRMPPATTRR